MELDKAINIQKQAISVTSSILQLPNKNDIDNDFNQQVVKFLEVLNFNIKNHEDFIENASKTTSESVLNACFSLRGVDNAWSNTLFTYQQVNEESIEHLFAKVLVHYITTYGKDYLEKEYNIHLDWETYFPNEMKQSPTKEDVIKFLENSIKEGKHTLFQNQPIEVTFYEDLYTYANKLKEIIYNLSKPIGDIEELITFLKNYLSAFNLQKVKFKENKILLMDLYPKITFINLSFEDVIRYIKFSLVGNSTLQYDKRIKNFFGGKDGIDRDRYWRLIRDSVTNYDEAARFCKQKRKLCNKIFRILDIHEYREKCETARFFKKLMNRRYSGIETKYSEFEKILSSNDTSKLLNFLEHNVSMINEKTYDILVYLESTKVDSYYLKKLVDLTNNLTLKSTIQTYNYLQSLKTFSSMDEDEYFFVHPAGFFATERMLVKLNDSILVYLDKLLQLLKENIKRRFKVSLRNWLQENDYDGIIVSNSSILVDNYKIPVSLRSSDIEVFPYQFGSYIPINDSNIIISGIYWENLGDIRVDLDLGVVFSSKDEVVTYGWNAKFRSSSESSKSYVIFTGDVTDAKNGAAEFVAFDMQYMLQNGFKFVTSIVSNFNAINNVPYYYGVQATSTSVERYAKIVKWDAHQYFNPHIVVFGYESKLGISQTIVSVVDLEMQRFYPLHIERLGSYGLTATAVQKNLYSLGIRLRCHEHSISFKDMEDCFNIEGENVLDVNTLDDLVKVTTQILI